MEMEKQGIKKKGVLSSGLKYLLLFLVVMLSRGIMNVNVENSNCCPVCRISLSVKNIDHKYDIQFCSSCRREFYPLKEDNQQNKLEYDDIKTVSEDGQRGGPILLCLEDNNINKTLLSRLGPPHTLSLTPELIKRH